MDKLKKTSRASNIKKGLTLFLILLSFSVSPRLTQANEPIWYQLYKSGIAKYKAKRYRKALNDLLRAISHRDDLHVAHKYIGFIYLHLNKNSLAKIYLKKSLTLKKNQSDALYRLGMLYFNSYSLNKAKRTLRKALETLSPQEPKRNQILYYLLRIAVIEKNRQDKKNLRQKINASDNGHSERLLKKAQKGLQKGQVQKAHAKLQQALKINPINIQVLMELASLYRKTQNGSRAIKLYHRVLLLQQEHEQAHIKLAHLYYERHRWQKSFRHFQRVVRINPRNKEAWIRYINMLRMLKKPNQRQKAIRRARSYGIKLPF